MSWLRTHSGLRFDPLNLNDAPVKIHDIAHALSNTGRFSGHTTEFYSVAQHSVMVSQIVGYLGGTPEEQFQGLLHDSTEAYLVDIPRPIKLTPMMAGYRDAEEKLEAHIASAFGLKTLTPGIVKQADHSALWAEARDLMGDPQDWDLDPPVYIWPRLVVPEQPSMAKFYFMGELRRVQAKMREERA